jgi:hypothetical protein
MKTSASVCYHSIYLSLSLFLLLFFNLSVLIAQPVVQSFSPATAATGSSIIVSGSQFSATASANTVYFGGVKAAVTAASASSLTVTVPKGANYSPLSVTVNGLTAYSPLAFIPIFSGGFSIDNNSFVYSQGLINDNYPRNVSFADFDGDGKADVLALKNLPSTSDLSFLWLYLNTSSTGNIHLTFQDTKMTGVFSSDMATADFDGDGKIDAVTTNIVDKEIAVLRNTSTLGTISFAGREITPTVESLNYIAVGDIDGDGKVDIIGTNSISGNGTILRNQSTPGNISFVRIMPFSIGLNPGMIVMSDLNGDNKPDLAVANELLNNFSLLRNTSTAGSFSFATAVSVPTPDSREAHYIAAGDLDMDGKNDLVFTTADNLGSVGNCYAFRNTSTVNDAISFINGGILPNGGLTNNAFCPAISDLNGDGKPDIILGKSGSPFVFQVLQNQSTTGVFSFNMSASFTSSSAYRIATGDLDGDSKPEIGTANFTGTYVDIYKNRCGQLAIADINVTSAGTGDTVTISGSNFIGITAVRFGGIAAASFSVVSANQLKAVIGAGASGNIVITGSTGADSIPGFVFDNGPKIDSFKPAMALATDTILIKGSRFLTTSSVTFGDVPATWFSVKDAHTILGIPGNGNTGAIKVTTTFGVATFSTPIFTLLHKPVVSSFSPTAAYTGQYIYIMGQYLTTPGYLPEITLGGVPIQVLEVNGNQTVAYGIVGNGASGSVKVSTFGVADSLGGFTYIPPPFIKSFSPTSAHPADTVTIIGAHFLEITSINFGDSAAGSFTVANDTLIKAVVGYGTTGILSVEKISGKGIKAGFTFIPLSPPVIQSFTPLQAISGSTITVTGQNLWGVIGIKIGNTPVKLFEQVTTKQLKIIVPVDATGAISVTTYYGSFTLSSTLFTRITPSTITSISPLNAVPGTAMTISGQGFGTNPLLVDVHFGAVKATINSIQDNLINVTIPTFVSYGPISITVKGLTTFSSQRFTPVNPAISYLNLNAKSFIEVSQGEDLYPTQGTLVHPIDINGDQKPDFITISLYGSVNYYINTSTPGKPSWRYSHTQPNIAYLDNAQEGDIDGDGKPDILAYGSEPSRYILRNTSTMDSCSFAQEPHAYSEPGLLFDITNDGKPDITRPDPVTFQPQIFINNSIPGFISFKDTINSANQTPLESWDLVLITDLDRDGLPDLIGRRYQQTLIFRNIGTKQVPAFTAPVIMNSLYNPINAVTADMNRDGTQDFFIQYADGTFSVYKNASTPGNILLKSHQLITNDRSGGFNSFIVADFNGDGRADIVTKTGYAAFLYQNSSTADSVIIKDTSTLFINNLWAICVADIDGDNKQDIVTSTSDLYVLRNRMNESQSTKICPGSNISLPAGITGSSYQWQMDSGSGFANISNDINFSTTTGAVLTITNTPSSWLKRQFRCKINNSIYSEPYFLEFENAWISNISHDWNIPANWACGVIPDGNTSVTITNGKTVELTGDGSCRSILINPYASFTVLPGFQLVITNK